MLERKTVVDLIEVHRDDSLGVRLALLVVDGEKELACQYHRVLFYPGQCVSTLMKEVNECLVGEGEEPVSAYDIFRIEEHMA